MDERFLDPSPAISSAASEKRSSSAGRSGYRSVPNATLSISLSPTGLGPSPAADRPLPLLRPSDAWRGHFGSQHPSRPFSRDPLDARHAPPLRRDHEQPLPVVAPEHAGEAAAVQVD